MQSEERALLGDLIREIQRLRGNCDELDEQLAVQVEEDPMMKVMSAAVGPAAATALTAYVGAPRQYESARAYEKACGLNLKVRSSGEHEGQLKITKRGPSKVRHLLYLAALRLCQHDETTRAWYQRRSSYSAGWKKSKMKAVVAVMRKLVRALWCIGHDPANPQTFDSSKLFDTRRLSITTEQSVEAETRVSPSRSAGQRSGGRTAHVRQPNKSSVAEVRP
jgi:transposase